MRRTLAKLLRGRPALVNLIPYNPVPGLPFRTPPVGRQRPGSSISLTQANLNVIIRYRKGAKISAACGQLRRGRGSGE